MTERVHHTLLSDEGSGIYESMKAYGGVLFRPEEHLDRFFESAKTLGLEVPETRKAIRRRIQKALDDSKKKEAFVRLTLVGKEIFLIIGERKHTRELYQHGVSLKTTVVRRNLTGAIFPEAKSTTGCVNQVLGSLDSPEGAYEILFLDSAGYLTEARIGNFFIIKNRCLYTPPPVGLLNGVTRRFVIECAHAGKIPVEEKPLMRHDLFNAEEAFLTNTSWEILPIREVDGRRVGEEIPGPVTKKLQTLFRTGVQRETKNQKPAHVKN